MRLVDRSMSGFPTAAIREALAASTAHPSSLPQLQNLFQQWENRSTNIQTIIKSALVSTNAKVVKPVSEDPESSYSLNPGELSNPPMPSQETSEAPELATSHTSESILESSKDDSAVRVQSAWRAKKAREELQAAKEAN